MCQNDSCQVRNDLDPSRRLKGTVSGFGRRTLLTLLSVGIVILLAACSSSVPQPDTLSPTATTTGTPQTPALTFTVSPPTPSPTSPPLTPTTTNRTPTLALTPTTIPEYIAELPGWIAFTAVLNPGTSVRIDLASINPDGHNQSWITDTDTDSLIGVFSVGGEQIAYWSFDLQTQISKLWVMDLETGSSKPVTTEGTNFMNPISWSPDSSYIAFEDTLSEDQAMDVFRVGVYDGELVNLTEDSPFRDGAPAWSPDGQWIAFHSNREGEQAESEDIWLMSPDGADLRNLTSTTLPWSDRFPAWSPDGRRIAFYRQGSVSDAISSADLPGLWVMNADGTNQKMLVPFDSFANEPPVWSPDGQWIAASDGVPDFSDIWLVPAQGGEAQPILIPGLERSACWSPDSSALMFTHDDGETLSLILVTLEPFDILPIELEGWGDYCDWTF